MPDYTNISWADFFSHIYIEKEALEYELTEQILAMYPDAVRIQIEHYKDIFNRPHQDCEIQKKSPFTGSCGKTWRTYLSRRKSVPEF